MISHALNRKAETTELLGRLAPTLRGGTTGRVPGTSAGISCSRLIQVCRQPVDLRNPRS
jgi:hypothetical protein